MKRYLQIPITLFAFGLALPAWADTCHDEISAMHDGGALDPRIRPPHRQTNTASDKDGNHIRTFETIVESPIRSVSGVVGGPLYALLIDTRSWTGPTIEGPWAEAPNHLPGDRLQQIDKLRQQKQNNLEQTVCPGMGEIEGQTLLNVQFVTKTDPNVDAGGSWFGSRNSVFIDPETSRVMRWEQSDFVNSWSEGVGTEQHVTVFEYDDTIRLEVP